MTNEDILALARLARIKLTDDEVSHFSSEIDAILAYVGTINTLVTETDTKKQVGAVSNVFREDIVTNEPGQYTEALLAAMPETERGFLKVKKILNTDD